MEPETPHSPAVRSPMPMKKSGPCWICGESDSIRVWTDPFDLSDHPRFGEYAHNKNHDSHLVRCKVCGFAQPEEMPGIDNYFDLLYSDQPWLDEEALVKDFDLGYKDYVFEEILGDLNRYLGPTVPKTLLDVGTYTGRFLEKASNAGFEVEAIELNTRAADYASRRTGKTIHRIKAEELADEGRRYGVVTMIDVLEHIPHPAPLVSQLKKLLVPGGILAITVPHGPMQRYKERLRGALYRTPEAREANRVGVMARFVHVNHFTASSLRRCLADAGFRPVHVLTAAPDFHQNDMTMTATEKRRALIRKTVYKSARTLPLGVYSPLSFNLQAYGINPG